MILLLQSTPSRLCSPTERSPPKSASAAPSQSVLGPITKTLFLLGLHARKLAERPLSTLRQGGSEHDHSPARAGARLHLEPQPCFDENPGVMRGETWRRIAEFGSLDEQACVLLHVTSWPTRIVHCVVKRLGWRVLVFLQGRGAGAAGVKDWRDGDEGRSNGHGQEAGRSRAPMVQSGSTV